MSKICLNHYGVMVAGTRDLGPFAEGIITLESDLSPCPFGSTEQVIPPIEEDVISCSGSEVLIQNSLTLEKKCWPASEEVPSGWVYLFGGGETEEPLPASNWWLWLALGLLAWRI